MPKNVKKFLTYGRKKIQLLPPHIYSVLNRFIQYEWFTLEVIKVCEGKQTYLRHAILKKGKKCHYFLFVQLSQKKQPPVSSTDGKNRRIMVDVHQGSASSVDRKIINTISMLHCQVFLVFIWISEYSLNIQFSGQKNGVFQILKFV